MGSSLLMSSQGQPRLGLAITQPYRSIHFCYTVLGLGIILGPVVGCNCLVLGSKCSPQWIPNLASRLVGIAMTMVIPLHGSSNNLPCTIDRSVLVTMLVLINKSLAICSMSGFVVFVCIAISYLLMGELLRLRWLHRANTNCRRLAQVPRSSICMRHSLSESPG